MGEFTTISNILGEYGWGGLLGIGSIIALFFIIKYLMNRQSNIIFTNENNIIIDTLKHTDNSQRAHLPAHLYEYPENSKKSFLKLNNFDEFYKIINSNNNK